MALIDVDKVDMPIMVRERNGWVCIGTIGELLRNSEPIVKAIPVDWLLKYYADCSVGFRNNDAKAVDKLLEDWEKENDTESYRTD